MSGGARNRVREAGNCEEHMGSVDLGQNWHTRRYRGERRGRGKEASRRSDRSGGGLKGKPEGASMAEGCRKGEYGGWNECVGSVGGGLRGSVCWERNSFFAQGGGSSFGGLEW